MPIDDVDFSIMKIIRDSRSPLWKKEIHRKLTDGGGLPNVQEVSVQTVGRRVDALHEDGHLESCIISPNEINRDLIIAFKITDQGHDVFAGKRREILRDYIFRSSILTDRETEPTSNTDILAELMVDELELGDTHLETLKDREARELLALLAVHYLREGIRDALDEEHVAGLAELALAAEELEEVLTEDVIDRGLHEEIRRRKNN